MPYSFGGFLLKSSAIPECQSATTRKWLSSKSDARFFRCQFLESQRGRQSCSPAESLSMTRLKRVVLFLISIFIVVDLLDEDGFFESLSVDKQKHVR